jgi:hypothetical protein
MKQSLELLGIISLMFLAIPLAWILVIIIVDYIKNLFKKP